MSAGSDRAALGRWLLIAALGGAAAVLLPVLVAGSDEPLLQAVADRPSVWTFHGLMVVGFIVGIMGPLQLLDVPLMALAMIGVFPAIAGFRLLLGDPRIVWQREFLLYAAWLTPAAGGLLLGRAIRVLQQRMRDRRR